jgi:hypothetical protein
MAGRGDAVEEVVVVPAVDRADRDHGGDGVLVLAADGLLDGRAGGDRAVVGAAGEADLAVGPRLVGDVVDHVDGVEDLVAVAVGLAAAGVAGAAQVHQRHRVAAGHEVVVVVLREGALLAAAEAGRARSGVDSRWWASCSGPPSRGRGC